MDVENVGVNARYICSRARNMIGGPRGSFVMRCEELCKCRKAARKEILRSGSIQKNDRYTSGADALVDALNKRSSETNREAKAQSTPKGKPRARRAVPGQEARERRVTNTCDDTYY